MSSWFKASPTIEFIYTIYEWYKEEVTTEYGGKKIETDLITKKIDTKNFNFFSSRDVTGPIIFSNENYSYIRFSLYQKLNLQMKLLIRTIKKKNQILLIPII